MNMSSAKRLASRYLNVGISRVKYFGDLGKVKEAITGDDIKNLVSEGIFTKVGQGHSRGRARINLEKKKSGRSRGPGKRKGSVKARTDPKDKWLKKVRSQRKFIKKLLLEGNVDNKVYRSLYRKIKGGFFRDKSHINVFLGK